MKRVAALVLALAAPFGGVAAIAVVEKIPFGLHDCVVVANDGGGASCCSAPSPA